MTQNYWQVHDDVITSNSFCFDIELEGHGTAMKQILILEVGYDVIGVVCKVVRRLQTSVRVSIVGSKNTPTSDEEVPL